MLAHRVQLDVAHHDHRLVLLLEHGVADHVGHVHVVAAREPGHRLGHAFGRLHEPLARGVLSKQLELAPHDVLELQEPVARDGLPAASNASEFGLHERGAAGGLSGRRIRHSDSPSPRA
jgi:hypothetical protein